jgi:secreted trypsin-like serine protease
LKTTFENLFEGRIIGGTKAQAGQFPYVAVVNVTTATSKIFCGGALLGDQWIVTAGQCVDQ